jgi:hypothetical protein
MQYIAESDVVPLYIYIICCAVLLSSVDVYSRSISFVGRLFHIIFIVVARSVAVIFLTGDRLICLEGKTYL